MRRLIKTALRFLVLLFFLLALASVLGTGTKLSSGSAPVIYYRSQDPLTADAVAQMRAEDDAAQLHVPFTACGSMQAQSFENPELGRTCSCGIVYISGDSALMTTSYGGELFTDDKLACLLSTGAASQLFGEKQVTGGEVSWDGKVYDVRGVVNCDEPLIIIPAASLASKSSTETETALMEEETNLEDSDLTDTPQENTEFSFTRVIINPEDESRRSEDIQIFENRNGFSSSSDEEGTGEASYSGTEPDKADCLVYQRLAGALMLLIPMIILVIAIVRVIQFCWRNRYRPFFLVVGLASIPLVWILFFRISGISLSIPADLIPTRWSDFEFWGRKINQFRTSIAHVLFMSKSEIELAYYEPLSAMAGMTIVEVILFFVNLRVQRAADRGKWPLELIGILVTELIAIGIMRGSIAHIDSIREFVMLWPFLMITAWLYGKDPGKIQEKNVRNSEQDS